MLGLLDYDLDLKYVALTSIYFGSEWSNRTACLIMYSLINKNNEMSVILDLH